MYVMTMRRTLALAGNPTLVLQVVSSLVTELSRLVKCSGEILVLKRKVKIG
jgi:hypothetical protein